MRLSRIYVACEECDWRTMRFVCGFDHLFREERYVPHASHPDDDEHRNLAMSERVIR